MDLFLRRSGEIRAQASEELQMQLFVENQATQHRLHAHILNLRSVRAVSTDSRLFQTDVLLHHLSGIFLIRRHLSVPVEAATVFHDAELGRTAQQRDDFAQDIQMQHFHPGDIAQGARGVAAMRREQPALIHVLVNRSQFSPFAGEIFRQQCRVKRILLLVGNRRIRRGRRSHVAHGIVVHIGPPVVFFLSLYL